MRVTAVAAAKCFTPLAASFGSLPGRRSSQLNNIIRRRYLSSEKKSTTPPSIKPNVNVLEEKARRAEQLHAELNDLLSKNEKRRADEQSAALGSGFFKFLADNKSQMINIGVSFLCVIFAHQIVGMRHYGRKLTKQFEESEQQLAETQATLQSLTEVAFVEQVATECANALDKDRIGRGRSWITRSSGDSSSTNLATLITAIQQILRRKIGDKGLTEDQKKSKAVHEMKLSMEKKSAEEKLLSKSTEEEMLSSPEAFLNQLLINDSKSATTAVEIIEDESGGKLVKRRKFSM